MAAETAKYRKNDESGALKTIAELWPYMWPRERPDLKRRVLWALFYLVLSKVILILVPYFFKYATDALVPGRAAPDWLPYLLAAPLMLVFCYNAARIIQAGLNQLRDALFASVGQHAVRKLAYETFVHMHRLSLRFHLEKRTGGLSRIIERGTKGIEAIVRFTILNSIPTVLECAMTAFVVWYSYGWLYFCIIVATVGCYVWFTVIASNWRITIRRAMNAADNEANSRAVDSLLNFETVKYFGNEELEARRFDTSMAQYESAATKTWVSLGWLNFGQVMIFGLGMLVLMLISAWQVRAGRQSVGDFVFINALLIQLSFPLNFIGSIYRDVRQGLTDIEQMFNLLNVPEEVADRPGAKALALSADNASIRFDNVVFGYDKDRTILKGISFTVPSGKTVAIVGPSGAGKSTISRLLFRFYDVQAGAVLVGEEDVRAITQKSLRRAIGMVPQDTVLFNDTIGYNIRYGRSGASDEEVQKAARLAQIDSFINSLPHGYETQVGERGLKLSGGEKQRVAIARTLLKAPPLLILDEATSALDTATEQEIQHALDTVSRGRTTLVIAHRLSTIIQADEILVLKAGRFVERGTHTALLAKKGLYASMWERQLEATAAEEKLRRIRREDKAGFPDKRLKAEKAE